MNYEYWLYVLVEEDEDGELGEFAKIGITTNLDRRIQAISNGSARPLHYLVAGSLGVISLQRAMHLEKAVHKRFEHMHYRGEWFRFTDEIYAWTDDLPSCPEIVYRLLERQQATAQDGAR